MKHPNTILLEKLYADFQKGDLKSVLAVCAESMTFQIPGKSKLSGKYDKSNVVNGFIEKLTSLSNGTFKLETHDILGSDLHAAVLATSRLTKDGKVVELRTVHIWRFQEGKPVAWYEYPRDLYQFDAIWT